MNIAALQEIVASDARARGASALCRPIFWGDALQLFIKASRIVIVTGFFIRSADACETDGPPGAVVLGRALARVGKHVVLITDRRNYECLKACSRSIGGPVVACVDEAQKIPMDMGLLVFIERPGHALDGRYYNMKGVDISDVVVPLDRAGERATRHGIPVLGIGDGGNEAGMGFFHDSLARVMPGYARCLSRVSSTVCLPVDISNWGAYALAAVLSSFYRRWLGLDENEEEAMLEALLNAGAVDGVSGKSEPSVDGLSLPELKKVTLEIKNWYFWSFRV